MALKPKVGSFFEMWLSGVGHSRPLLVLPARPARTAKRDTVRLVAVRECRPVDRARFEPYQELSGITGAAPAAPVPMAEA